MTPDKALDLIREAAVAGRITYTRHARERMAERMMTAEDVRAVLLTPPRDIGCSESNDTGPHGAQRWKVEGFDLNTVPRTVVVEVVSDALVVTVW